MATTFVDYDGDGNATKSFSFPSIKEADIKVDVDGVIKTSGNLYNITSYTTTGGGNVVFTAGNIPQTSANKIRIFRDTDVDTAKATFTAGSSIKAGDLNNNMTQVLYAAQEEQNQTIIASDLKDSVITTVKIADDAVTTDKLANSIVADITANTAKVTNATHTGDVTGSTALTIAPNAVDSGKIANGAIVNDDLNASAAIAHSKLAAVPDGQVLVGNGSTVPTAVPISGDVSLANTGAVTIAPDAVEIGMLGCEQTTITDSDSHIPTSGAVVDYVAAQIAPIGGLEVIATDAAFPNTQPSAGVVISIADAGGLVVNGSGTSTTGRTVGGSTVTINNIASNFNSSTVDAGVCFQVSSTGSGQVYNYHKATLKEADLLNLSNDINDFANRYRVNAGEPGSNNDAGDLVFDTNASKMKVYDGSSWGEVTSTGDFKYLFLCPAGGSGAPTLDGSIATYDLREGSNSGTGASVTSAAQLIVSVNGVIQKPNTGTSAPAEGFALVDTNTIIFGANLASGDSVFIIQIGSAVSIPTPGQNTVNSDKIIDGSIVNVDINASADIAGSKLADDSIAEVKLDIHNAPSGTDKFLAYTSNGMEWAVPTDTTVGGATGVDFNDNVKIRLGSLNEVEFFHTGTATNLIVSQHYFNLQANGYFFYNQAGDETLLSLEQNGAVKLYYDNVEKAKTSPEGLDLKDDTKLRLGDDNDLHLYHQSSNSTSYIQNATDTDLTIMNNGTNIYIKSANGAKRANFIEDGAVELYHNNVKKIETTTTGVTVTGAVTDSKGDVRSIPANAQSGAYVAVAADAGKVIYISTGGVTLNDSVFSAGDAVTIINNSGSDQTITQGSGVSLYNTADATTGNKTLAGRGMATVWFAAANTAYISGSGLS